MQASRCQQRFIRASGFRPSGSWITPTSSRNRSTISGKACRKDTTRNCQSSLAVRQAGLPRVYRIASEIVAESDGALDAEIIRNFLVAFQSVAPLKIGELWAVPPMLRLRLIECLRSLAIEVEQLQRGSEEADFWANRLITAARRSPERLLDDDWRNWCNVIRNRRRILRASW